MTLLLTILIAYACLAIILYAGGRFVHGALYTDIPPDLYWRGPAAAGLITVAALAWPILFNVMVGANNEANPKWPISFNDIFISTRATATSIRFKEFIAPAERGRREIRYRLVEKHRYRDAEGKPLPEATPPATLVGIAEDGEKINLSIIKDAEGFVDRSRGYFRYQDEQGRIMEDFGEITSFRWGQFFLNGLGMLVAWAAWFVGMWIGLLFQGHHALVLSFPLFLISSFVWNFIPL